MGYRDRDMVRVRVRVGANGFESWVAVGRQLDEVGEGLAHLVRGRGRGRGRDRVRVRVGFRGRGRGRIRGRVRAGWRTRSSKLSHTLSSSEAPIDQT